MATSPLDVTVSGLLEGAVRTVRPSMSLHRAAEELAADSIGLLVVEQPAGVVAGVVSERDVIRAMAEGADLDAERIADIMIDDVITVAETTTVGEAAKAMVAGDVRHLVVVDEDHRAVGIVSVRDVMKVVVDARNDLAGAST